MVSSAAVVSADDTDVTAGSSVVVGAAFPDVIAFPPPTLPLVTAVLCPATTASREREYTRKEKRAARMMGDHEREDGYFG